MTDKRNIKICCNDMGNARMMGNFRDYKGREKDLIGSIVIFDDKLYIAWADGDCTPLNYCPSCGKKVELVKE